MFRLLEVRMGIGYVNDVLRENIVRGDHLINYVQRDDILMMRMPSLNRPVNGVLWVLIVRVVLT